jgi:uncharacterized membrane protein YkoI
MKKIILSLVLTVCFLGLVGCGENMNNPSTQMGSGTNSGSSNNMSSNLSSNLSSTLSSVESSAQSAVDKVTSGAKELVAKITGNEAKQKALTHAGLKENEVTDLDIDLDRDGSTLVYEVDFKKGNIEFDYNINALTGEIISADKDRN